MSWLVDVADDLVCLETGARIGVRTAGVEDAEVTLYAPGVKPACLYRGPKGQADTYWMMLEKHLVARKRPSGAS